jgi:pseudouridine kinase
MWYQTQDPNDPKHVLVVGAASIDIVGRLPGKIEPGTSTPAQIHTSFGGTARNFAENLARLGQPVILISAVGKDQLGRQLIKTTQKAGVDVEHVIRTKGLSTGAYIAVVNQAGELQFALDDMNAITALTPEYLIDRTSLFEKALMLFLDTNLPPESLETTIRLAQEANLPIAADPTSVLLTHRLIPHLSQIDLIAPNHKEAEILCNQTVSRKDRDQGQEAAKHLVSKGVDFAIVTLAEFGVCYATSETSGYIPAIRTKIVDPTGGGDALSAAVVFALLNGIPEDEAVRLGISAASLTLRHTGAVHPDLSLELLYDQLL